MESFEPICHEMRPICKLGSLQLILACCWHPSSWDKYKVVPAILI